MKEYISRRMNRLLGYLASVSWFLLAAVTALGPLLGSSSVAPVNAVMAMVFTCCAVFFLWRTNTVETLRIAFKGSPELRQFLLVDLISATATLLLGIVLLTGAVFRVWFEGLPVFG